MDRRRFVVGLMVGGLAAPLRVAAQPPKELWRIGILASGYRKTAVAPDLLSQALREIGYIEGQNLRLDWRFAEGDVTRLPQFASEFVRLNVDVVVTGFMSEVLAARRATGTIPIVMLGSVDPVGNGLAVSLSHPGKNVTGMTSPPSDFGGKQVQLLKQAVPRLARPAVIWDPTFPGLPPLYEHAEIAARKLGLALQSTEVRRPTDIDRSLARIAQDRADGVAIWPTNLIALHLPRILEFATQKGLPTILASTAFTGTSALMAYGVNQAVLCRRVAAFIDKVFKGAHPGELPLEQPTKFDLVINLKLAKALGLTIPWSLVLQADQVIE